MKKTKGTNASIFELNGIPQLSKALPLALQHVVAMIVGCVTPAIIVAGVAELEGTNRVMLIQSALVVSALSTFLQLFPIGSKKGFRLGAGLPVIMVRLHFFNSMVKLLIILTSAFCLCYPHQSWIKTFLLNYHFQILLHVL